jgi:hypothetical protein
MGGASTRDERVSDWDSLDTGLDFDSMERVGASKDLRAKTAGRPGKAAKAGKDEFDPVAAAEAAMARLAPSFNMWIGEKIDRLVALHTESEAKGLNTETVAAMFGVAHELKGESATFGYPVAGLVAGSLCRLLELTPGPRFIPAVLVTQHVQAMRAIVAERAQDGNKTASTLAARLKEVTDEYVARFA